MKREKVHFLGLQFDNLSKKKALDKIEEFIRQKTPRKIFTVNVELLVLIQA